MAKAKGKAKEKANAKEKAGEGEGESESNGSNHCDSWSQTAYYGRACSVMLHCEQWPSSVLKSISGPISGPISPDNVACFLFATQTHANCGLKTKPLLIRTEVNYRV